MLGCNKIKNNNDDDNDRYNLLVEFAHRHLDFQRAELESVLEMHGLDKATYTILPLPNHVAHSQEASSNNNKQESCTSSNPRPFLILSFPSSAISRLFLLDKVISDNDNDAATAAETQEQKENASSLSSHTASPLLQLSDILSRCTLVRSVVELWGMGTTVDSCASATSDWVQHSTLGQCLFQRCCQAWHPWKMTIHTLGSTFTREEQQDFRHQFSNLGFQGKVRMKNSNEFLLIREIELDRMGAAKYPRHGHDKVLIPENNARPPLGVYFGRVLGGVRSLKGRGGVDQYSLKKRAYLGPTSMDAELSLIMANLGQVQKGSFCFDPFVGTGSILLTCALRGGYCFGTDIDLCVLRGRDKHQTIGRNFDQFQLVPPEIVRSDNALYHRHYRTNVPLYDAIVCDPPYGVRAGAKRSGSKRDNPTPIRDEQRHDHIPQTKPYAVSDVMSDLLNVAAQTLVLGGRLVYIIPSMSSDFDVTTDLPRHETLELVHVCYQPLSTELGRRMVTMKKIRNYDSTKKDEYLQNTWVHGPKSAEKCANLRDKLLEVAKQKPGYAEKARMRKQKRKAKREAQKVAKQKNQTST